MTGLLYLLRHGETEWSRSGQHTSHTDIPLTPNGEQRARDAGSMLAGLREDRPLALVVSSPRQRAVRTAELAGLTVTEVTEDVAEWDYGSYEGLSTPKIRETVPGWTVWTHESPGGETADDVGARAASVVARVRAVLPDGDVVLVGHGHFSRVLVATWLGLPPTSGVHFALDAAAISVLGDERGVPQIKRLNVPPLPERGFPHD
ncbi:acid phosphatase [Actinophytocola algeriensis]|uniref:Putative phosphoglycerate mutase n=1 Tax=Actinophytocola algeriensis TaxID=1768010 RepID=A0A7W7PZ89_9PSEU|nr:acid phosphatase [Actinophytocola algeriensis]MBB4903979.1 putative phosphoglycerate mutase [Actinophytocola algeriensis]MBE1477164.1 putative phosphoglycerate mutase [Actinophytocola algeriensis]